MNLFSTDSPIMRILSLLSDLLILHFLWLLYSLPVITIGASTTALYYTMMKRIRTDEGMLFHNFHSSFRSNLKQATILWLLVILAIMVLILDFRFCLMFPVEVRKLMLIAYALILIPVSFTCLYVFPVQAKFENRTINNLKNAFLMSILNFPYTLLLVLLTGLSLIIGFLFPQWILIFLIFGMGVYSYITSFVYIKVFRKYIPNEEEEDKEKRGEKLYSHSI